MKTCRTLYSFGIPCLLRGDILIHSTSTLASFKQFMFAQSPSGERFPLLHGLVIDISLQHLLEWPDTDYEEEVGFSIVQDEARERDLEHTEKLNQIRDLMPLILRNATHLRRFAHIYCENIFVFYVPVSEALFQSVSSIRTLEQLTIDELGDSHLVKLLNSISSPISTLRLRHGDRFDLQGHPVFLTLVLFFSRTHSPNYHYRMWRSARLISNYLMSRSLPSLLRARAMVRIESALSSGHSPTCGGSPSGTDRRRLMISTWEFGSPTKLSWVNLRRDGPRWKCYPGIQVPWAPLA